MDIFTEYQSADSERKRELESELIQQHIGLAVWVAQSFVFSLGPDDAKQEAYIGLLEAIRLYDPSRAKFSTFAAIIIRQRLSEAARQWCKYNCESLDELAEIPERRNEFEKALRFDDTAFENVSYASLLSALKKKLSEREYDVLLRRLNEESLESIGETYSLSKERIRKIEESARRKAWKMLA